VITTVPTPADLVDMGGKPHDVILGPWGYLAYVTVLGVAGENDYVIQFNTHTFEEIGRAAVGKDPHVSLNLWNRWLYVPCQNSDVVVVLNRFNMQQHTEIEVPGAHGAGMNLFGRYFYTTNLPGGGSDALYTIDTRNNSLVGDPVDSPYPVPHNLALSSNGKKLFLTHSGGSSDKVTVYRMRGRVPSPEFVSEVTVGLNPFGIAYVK
jgi:DNA-binding beta-propeller fold protein YncE